MIRFHYPAARNKSGSSIAEFGPGLAIVIPVVGLVSFFGLFLLAQLTLQFACQSAVGQASAAFNREQVNALVGEADAQLKKGIFGAMLDEKQSGDGMLFGIKATPANTLPNANIDTGTQQACYIRSRYHMRALLPGINFVVQAEAHGQLEHPEGFRNAR